MSKANNTQVGGTHYTQEGRPQHWDLVQMYGWDYFQGQITKYLMRWKTKHNTPEKRLEDLKKARHFLDKYIELNEGEAKNATQVGKTGDYHYKLDSNDQFQCEGYYGDNTQLYKCLRCGVNLRATNLLDAEVQHRACPAEPTSGYVNQG